MSGDTLMRLGMLLARDGGVLVEGNNDAVRKVLHSGQVRIDAFLPYMKADGSSGRLLLLRSADTVPPVQTADIFELVRVADLADDEGSDGDGN